MLCKYNILCGEEEMTNKKRNERKKKNFLLTRKRYIV